MKSKSIVSKEEAQKQSNGRAILGMLFMVYVPVVYYAIYMCWLKATTTGDINFPVFEMILIGAWNILGCVVVYAVRPSLYRFVTPISSFLLSPLFLVWPLFFVFKIN